MTYASVGAPVPRVAYAVGKRVGGSVVRNRVRRRLRAVVSHIDGLAPGAYLVSVGPDVVGMAYEELRSVVATAMTAAWTKGQR